MATHKMPSMSETFEFVKSENYDFYLYSIGVSYWNRQVLTAWNPVNPPTITITNKEDDWSITTTTPLKTTEIKFKLGEEFDDIADNDRPCKSVITQEGENKLVQIQKVANSNGFTLTTVREFTDNNKMKITMDSTKKVASAHLYQKQ